VTRTEYCVTATENNGRTIGTLDKITEQLRQLREATA
jgi:hypothetical protein